MAHGNFPRRWSLSLYKGNLLDYFISRIPDHPTKLDDDGKMLMALHAYLNCYDDDVNYFSMLLFAVV